MAKPTEEKQEKPQGKTLELSPSMMIIISNAVIVVVIIVSMLILYLLLDSSFSKKIAKLIPQDNVEESDDDENEKKQEGVLLDLGEFILNLADTGKSRYLKVNVAMEISKTEAEIAAASAPAPKASGHGEGAAPPDPTAAIIAEMERYKPAIRDSVISVLSNKTADELSSPTGKEIAKEEILEMVNGIFDGTREVMRVSFGQFIIQ